MSSNKVILATLVNGLNYSHGHELFEQGVPKEVDATMRTKLLKVIDSKPFADGTKGRIRKFHIQEHDAEEAQAILEKYGNVKPKEEDLDVLDALQDGNPDAEVVMDALMPSEIEEFLDQERREEIETPEVQTKPKGRTKPQA